MNQWHRSLLDAVQAAMHRWVRIKSNMALGAYETFAAVATIADPVWPEPHSRNCCGLPSATAWLTAWTIP